MLKNKTTPPDKSLALKEKYGDAMVAVIPRSFVMDAKLNNGWTPANQTKRINVNNVMGNLIYIANNHHSMISRYIAEQRSEFKQLIPYVIVKHKETGHYFTTSRLSGDERLIGKTSLGIGGHIEGTESIYGGMYRELEEEIGLTDKDIVSNSFQGYIYDNADEVGRMHLGLVFLLVTDKDDIICMEKDTLVGGWFSVSMIETIRDAGLLENWSEIVLDNLIKGESKEGGEK